MLAFKESGHDFGTIYQLETKEYAFVFRNTDSKPVKVLAHTSCGCAKAEAPAAEVASGGKGTIRVSLTPVFERGKITKHVFVFLDNPLRTVCTLDFTADVKADVEIAPKGIYFGKIRPGEVVERSVVIRPAEVKRFRILRTEAKDSHMTVLPPAAAKPPEPPGTYRLTVRIGPIAQEGPVDAPITVYTDLPHLTKVGIPVYGRVVKAESTLRTRPASQASPSTR